MYPRRSRHSDRTVSFSTWTPHGVLGSSIALPFNPRTRIAFEVPVDVRNTPTVVQLALFDVHGRRVRVLVDALLESGRYSVDWDGRDDRGGEVGSGVYVARLRVHSRVVSRKMTLLR